MISGFKPLTSYLFTNTYLLYPILAIIFLSLTLSGCMFFNRQPAKSSEQVMEEYQQLQSREDLTVATLAGGCFWCMEGPFEAIDGVEEVMSGFSGGTKENPTYNEVAGGMTDYREAVQIFYDPDKVEYKMLLETYFWQIDPTDDDGQFSDRGMQYTTAIFYHSQEEKAAAETYIQELNQSGRYDKPIVTQVISYTNFYPAGDDHQDFYQKQSDYYKRYSEGSGRTGYIEQLKSKFGNK